MSDHKTHSILRDALLDFFQNHSDTAAFDPFRGNMTRCGGDWVPTPKKELPVTRFLDKAVESACHESHDLLSLFARYSKKLKWEQTYTQGKDSIGDDMVNGYGFVEIIGKWGPFVSTQVRAGIGLFAPNVNYPMHYHGAEEVYCLLSGSADFRFDEGLTQRRDAGDTVYIRSMRHHGFRILSSPLAIFYIWQAGDLREKSTFVE